MKIKSIGLCSQAKFTSPPPRKKVHELIIAHVLLGTVVICKK